MLTGNDALRIRTRLVAAVFILFFLCLWGRLYYVQVVRHEELFSKARRQYTTTRTTTSKRGEIFDIDGNLLVGNVPCDDIIADPSITSKNLEKCRQLTKLLAYYLKLDSEELYEKLSKGTRTVTTKDGKKETRKVRYAVIAREVPLETASELKSIIYPKKKRRNRKIGFRGIFFKESHKRYYPKGKMLSNILGFINVSEDKVIPVLGIERFMNKKLSSTKSKVRYERSRDGRILTYAETPQHKTHDGWDVFLTISEPLQSILEEELEKLCAKWKPRAAYAILADPYTGNILAVAQRPTFDPNDRAHMDPASWRSRFSSDVFDPGSTMKPIAISGAIDAGIVNPDSRLDCEKGAWFYGGRILHDSHPLDILTVSEVVQKSSNIGTAKIALLMGKKGLNNTLRSFGFGARTGIQLKTETRGLFRKPSQWDTLSITRFPIGQGIACSPLQLVRAYCALANHGKLPRLRLIDRLQRPGKKKPIKLWTPKPVQLFRNPATWKKMIDMMVLVTKKGGTARRAAIPGYEVAGKTGTSQKFIDGAYSHSKYFATFIGFVPAYKPAFVLLVTADEPKGASYGGTVAAPTFKNISVRTLKYMGIKPDEKLLEEK